MKCTLINIQPLKLQKDIWGPGGRYTLASDSLWVLRSFPARYVYSGSVKSSSRLRTTRH
jgi:hypothetical protein